MLWAYARHFLTRHGNFFIVFYCILAYFTMYFTA